MTNRKAEHVHGMWAYVADRWEEHADYSELRCGAINQAMIEPLAIAGTDRVLELACGPGGFGIALAATAREVVLSDVVPRMVEIAAKRAADRGVLNTTTAVLDLEEIDQPDASYDVVVCREGLMFATDPSAAVSEIHRVLRPRGRTAISVWGDKASNPWLCVPFTVMSERIGHDVPPQGMPGPFSLSDRDELVAYLEAAGFGGIQATSVEVPLWAPSVDAWWERVKRVMPLAKILDRSSPDRAAAVDAAVIEAALSYENADGSVTFPGLAHVVTAKR